MARKKPPEERVVQFEIYPKQHQLTLLESAAKRAGFEYTDRWIVDVALREATKLIAQPERP